MKALQIVNYGEIKDSLVFNDVSKPTVQSKDVLIEVKAAAINPIDKSIILGNLQGMLPISFPSTTAYDVSGMVVETGVEVSNFENHWSKMKKLDQSLIKYILSRRVLRHSLI